MIIASNPTAAYDRPGGGIVAAFPPVPKKARANIDPTTAAPNCTTQYTWAITQPMSRRSAKANVVAG